MKYVVLSICWALGLMTFAQFLSVDPASADIFDGETTAKVLNVRTGPSTRHAVVTSVPHGTQVSILQVDDGWARISTRTEDGLLDGWVSGRYLELYEIALPQVASSGVEIDADDELPALSQPVTEDVAASEPVAETERDSGVGAGTATSAVSGEAGAQGNPAATEEDAPAQSAVAEQVMAPKPEPADDADVQTSSVSEDVAMQPALSEPVAEKEISEPLAFQPLDISCRRDYFTDALEACTADIKVDVVLPEDLAGLFTDKLNVRCDIDYLYDAGGKRLTEVRSDIVEIDLDDGKGSAILESRIDFLFSLEEVTRVEVGDINCGGVN